MSRSQESDDTKGLKIPLTYLGKEIRWQKTQVPNVIAI